MLNSKILITILLYISSYYPLPMINKYLYIARC
ncbi:hypothetical protein GMB51_10940 [Turicibacter sanguinis]|nr:hypothetical protein [Turicibacter sanguinis]MTN51407.1 hypothetical protein [Turicibacter sanguinis]MTN54604.1 hypothetical protein [Turicibacter sanguinis]MTN57737.1 hypothetical protein [Turicibacter sanguinis]MTN60753.1 hypothetical protein [Turicibacter sanguinis]